MRALSVCGQIFQKNPGRVQSLNFRPPPSRQCLYFASPHPNRKTFAAEYDDNSNEDDDDGDDDDDHVA